MDGNGGCEVRGGFVRSQSPYCCGIVLMECIYQLVGINVGQGFPTVMGFGETLPSDQILELVMPLSCAQDLFDFPLGWLLMRSGAGSVKFAPCSFISL